MKIVGLWGLLFKLDGCYTETVQQRVELFNVIERRRFKFHTIFVTHEWVNVSAKIINNVVRWFCGYWKIRFVLYLIK